MQDREWADVRGQRRDNSRERSPVRLLLVLKTNHGRRGNVMNRNQRRTSAPRTWT